MALHPHYLVAQSCPISLHWCTEIGQHCSTNWPVATGKNAVPYLLPESSLQAGAVLHLLPDITKNKKSKARRQVAASKSLRHDCHSRLYSMSLCSKSICWCGSVHVLLLLQI